MAGPPQNAAIHCPQRKNMPRTGEIARSCCRIDQCLNGCGPIFRRHACCRPVDIIYRDGERSLVERRVRLYHSLKTELSCALPGDRRAHDAPAFANKEIDDFRSDLLSGGDKIAFVLAVFIVHNDQHFPLTEVFQCFFDRMESGLLASHDAPELLRCRLRLFDHGSDRAAIDLNLHVVSDLNENGFVVEP